MGVSFSKFLRYKFERSLGLPAPVQIPILQMARLRPTKGEGLPNVHSLSQPGFGEVVFVQCHVCV